MGTSCLFWSSLTALALSSIWELYINWRQLLVSKSNKDIPDELIRQMDKATFRKTADYSVRKITFDLKHGLFQLCSELGFIVLGGLPMTWALSGRIAEKTGRHCEILQSNVFVLILMVASKLMDLPWRMYYNFVIEEEFGFNKQTVGFYLKDQLKKTSLLIAIVLPIMSALLKIIRWKGDSFFFYAGLLIVVSCMGLLLLYPDFIAPLFDDFRPMPNCELKTRIEQLARSVRFPSFKIFIVEGSKKSSHSNAYFMGLFRTRRIVLYDTLVGHLLNDTNKDERRIDEITGDEVVSVLAHELGHWKYGHIYTLMLIVFLQVFAAFYAFSYLYKAPVIYRAFGFEDSMPILIGLLITFGFILAPVSEVDELLTTMLSRHFERQADRFAAQLRPGEHLIQALLKLQTQNLDYPHDDWLYSACKLSHPPVLERIRLVKEMKKD